MFLRCRGLTPSPGASEPMMSENRLGSGLLHHHKTVVMSSGSFCYVLTPSLYCACVLRGQSFSHSLSPPALIEQDLRPISLTCTLAKVMEGFTCSRLLPQLEGKIDSCQFSRKGHSTTDALIYMLQAIYEAVDSGEASARIFFADKGVLLRGLI